MIRILRGAEAKIAEGRSLHDGLSPLQRDARIEALDKGGIAAAR
jgi:hypothetical protein